MRRAAQSRPHPATCHVKFGAFFEPSICLRNRFSWFFRLLDNLVFPSDRCGSTPNLMAKDLKKGDPVEWNTPQGKTTGKVKKKVTSFLKIKGHEVKASKDNPEYLVETDKSHKEAAHAPESLRKTGRKK